MPSIDNPYAGYLAIPGPTLPAQTVAQLAPMTALQNMCIDADGTILMTSLLDGRIWRVRHGGQPELFARIDGRPSGISPTSDGCWLVFGWDMAGGVAAFKLYSDGSWDIFANVDGGIFPNGACRIGTDDYIFADSVAATIWHVNYQTRAVDAWYRHPLFAPRDGEWDPALNGLQMFDNWLYLSNSSTKQLLRMPISNGRPGGPPEIVRDNIALDDFAFDMDGVLYSATHPNDVILKLTPAGELTRAAGPAEGVRGCTACQFSPKSGDETGLYVIADGGLFNPLSGGLQNARVVRLETGIAGIPSGQRSLS